MMIPSLVVVALLASCQVEALRTSRYLSYEKIGGYEPNTKVTDHNAIDLDQKAMETQLELGTADAFILAKAIYEKGGNSKSFATVTLSTPVASTLLKETSAAGMSASGAVVPGTLYADVSASELQFLYNTTSMQASYSTCQVGGLVEPNLVGCLASNGTITVGTTPLAYTYTPATGNTNGRTLQYFSTKADTKMRHNEASTGAYYDHFQKFVDYYTIPTYSDVIIQAAFAKGSAALGSRIINFDALDTDPAADFGARNQIIKKTSVFLGVAMYVIRELEDALDDCNADTPEDNAGSVNAVDEAVAFYTGSLEGADGSGSGVLLHALADKRCANFKTCTETGKETTGTAKVNLEIFKSFNSMAKNVIAGDCTKATEDKEKIVSQIFIPMIQGTLRYAKIRSTDAAKSKDVAEGAAFAMALLPMVHKCNARSAEIIFENMLPGSPAIIDHKAVKSALENTYGCLKITCADVGGVVDEATGNYYPDMAPCGGSSGGANVGLAVGLSIGGVVVLALIAMFVKRQKAGSAEFKTDNV